MNRRTFFANLLGGSVAALWPYPPKPIIVRAEPPKLFAVCPDCGGYDGVHSRQFCNGALLPRQNRDLYFPFGETRDMRWPDGETLAYRK